MSRCNRVWQAEAREDGRLDPQGVASFERHSASCEDCAAEVEGLRRIRRSMSALPEPARTDLEHRRLRAELQRRAHEQPQSSRSRAPWVLALAASLALAWLVVARRAPGRPAFEVVDLAHATWSLESRDGTSVVRLRSGAASFHVEPLNAGRRFFVSMPDGSIEVRGTRFVVDVVDGHTRKVDVSEGIVQLKVPGFEGLLRAGDHWSFGDGSAAVAAQPPQASGASPTMTEPASAAPPPSSSGAAASPLAATTASSKGAPGPRFAEAMSAYSGGAYARADALFAAFVREFPADARAEDAMFLRARARAKSGDKAGAAALAREYLERYPNGLRRPEAVRLSNEE